MPPTHARLSPCRACYLPPTLTAVVARRRWKARVLNASNAEELQHILGPWDARLSREHTLCSDDDDPELLITIPFTSDVKVRVFPPSRVFADHGPGV